MKYKEIQRLRTRSTVLILLDLLKDISVDDLITDLFVYTEDEEAINLIKRYEKTIIKGKVKENFLRDNLNVFYRDMSKYLKQNNLFKKFIDLIYFVYSSLGNNSVDSKNRTGLNIYLNLLFQQFEYLTPFGQIIYGITTKGKLMTRKQLFPYSDYPTYEIEKNNVTDKAKIVKIFKKYGYTDKILKDIEMYITDDGLIENMIRIMIKFVDEKNEDIVPDKFLYPSKNGNFCNISILENIDDIKKGLKKRNYMLPAKGILAMYKNAGVHSLLLKEVFKDDKIYLIYKITNIKKEGAYGFYDLKNGFFYSIYRDTSVEKTLHKNIEKFVLKTYSMLTTNTQQTKDLIQVDDLKMGIRKYPTKPIVRFLFKEENGENNKKKYRNFDKNKYIETMVSVKPYIRKLPAGAVVSEEAIKKAKHFGYELGENETFVSPFTRATFKKN
jgi:hypothetical protein